MRRLELGQAGDVDAVPQMLSDGRWVRAPRAQKATRWRARIYVRGHDGERREFARFAPSRRAAEKAAQSAAVDFLRASDAPITRTTPLLEAGEHWLAQIARPESGLSQRTIRDYSSAWALHIVPGSLRGLTLEQANDPQRIRAFLQRVADSKGSGAAKKVKSVLSGLLTFAVSNGVLPYSAVRQVRGVKAAVPREEVRDRSRAFTRAERDEVLRVADALVDAPDLDPRTRRTRQSTADLVAILAGTGVRIDEARQLAWADLDLATGLLRVRGTKSETSDRRLNLPTWLGERLRRRAERSTGDGLIIPSPAHLDQPAKTWDRSNSAGAVRNVLDAAGMSWAVPHTFRRTVATLLDAQGAPISRIADWLGHADVSMTARVYLGRDLKGDKSDLAELL